MYSDRTDISSFAQNAISIEGTPALIQWLVEDSLRLETAKAIVSKKPESLYHLTESVCTENRIDMARLELCLSPAISSLGLLEGVEFQGDFYELLEISSDADADQIKKAYREIVRRIHPDVTTDLNDGHDQFTSVTQAYKTLSNPGLRRQYDQTRIKSVSWQEAPPPSRAANGNGHQSSKPWLKISLAGAGILILFVFMSLYFESVFYRQSLTEPVRPHSSVLSKSVAPRPKSPLRRTVAIPQPPAAGEDESRPPSIEPKLSTPAPKHVNYISKRDVKPGPKPIPKALPERPTTLTEPLTTTPSGRPKKPMNPPEASSKPTSSTTPDKPSTTTDKIDPVISVAQINDHEINSPEPDITPVQKPPRAPSLPVPERQASTSEKEEALQLLSQMIERPSHGHSRPGDINSKIDQLTGADRKQAVLDFVQTYADIYTRKNPEAYLALFAPDATQNGKPIGSLRDEYTSTLENKEAVAYRVEVHQVVFDPFRHTARAVSHFELKFQSGDYLKTHSGPITFTLDNKLAGPLTIRDLHFEITDQQEAFNPPSPPIASTAASATETLPPLTETGVNAQKAAVKQADPPSGEAKPSPENKVVPDSLRDFIQRYTASYEDRDIDRYKQLFGQGATENEEPFQSRTTVYEKQFRELTDVDYQLKILDWKKRENAETGFLVTCSYNIAFSRKGRRRSSNGKITFSIKDEKGILKIESMRY